MVKEIGESLSYFRIDGGGEGANVHRFVKGLRDLVDVSLASPPIEAIFPTLEQPLDICKRGAV